MDTRSRPALDERTPPLVLPPIPRVRRTLPSAGLYSPMNAAKLVRRGDRYTASVRTLVLALGNPLLGDDAVGLEVARVLRERLAGRPDTELVEDEAGGIQLMERMTGFDRAIVVDAILSGAAPGTIHRLGPGEIPTQRTAVAHGIDLPRALELGRSLGLPMPGEVRVVAIEAESVLEFREFMTPAVAAAVLPAVAAVLEELDAAAVRG